MSPAQERAVAERLQLVLQQLPCMVWTTDSELVITSIDGAALSVVGLRQGQTVGLNLAEVTGPEGTPTVLNAHRAALAGDSATYELVWSSRLYESRVEPLRDAQGNIVGTVGIAVDVSERSAAEAEHQRLLEQSRRALRIRDEFLSVASHELRTPLTTLKVQLEVLRRRFKQGPLETAREKLEQLSEAASRQGDRLALLVANLLDVARLAEGQWKVDSKKVDLVQLVQRAIDELASPRGHAGSEVRLHASGSIVGLWDGMGLHQVVTNLLSNALKYGRGAPVDVTVERRQGRAQLRVKDAGIGIEPEDLQRIFGRFERGASARNYGGLGLGLFIVRQIVDAHGGHVRVSTEVGVGSTFEVELPLKSSAA